jgi:hypothetical protein
MILEEGKNYFEGRGNYSEEPRATVILTNAIPLSYLYS